MAPTLTLRGVAESLWEGVAPDLPSFSVEVLAEIDSTNSELMRRAKAGQIEPTLLIAERQTAGRGRLGRDWHSVADAKAKPEANPQTQEADIGRSLTFSLGLSLPVTDWSGLSLAVGLSVVQSLHSDLQLKWPNDVWLADRKMAGILIETTAVADQRYAVVGIGVNILPRPEQNLRTPAAALIELLPDCTAATALLAIVPTLVRDLKRFTAQGFAAFVPEFQARDALVGRWVQTSGPASEVLEGWAQGVDSSGALLVHTAQGVRKINSSEVSVRPASVPIPTRSQSA